MIPFTFLKKFLIHLTVTFLYEINICAGAKSTDAIINNIDLLIIPLNKKITDGITDNDTALKTVFLLKQMNHIAQ